MVTPARLVALLVLAPAATALAQAPGLPVINAGPARGVTVAGMVGFGNQAAGDATTFGVTGTLGFRRVAVSGFVARAGGTNLSDNAVTSGGGAVAIKLLGGPLVPVSVNLQAGAAYLAPGEATMWRVPVGIGISWTIPQPVVAIKPWVAPRLDYSRVTAPVAGQPDRATSTDTDFGLSGGVTFGFLNGVALDVAADRVFAGAGKPTTIGLGLSFNFR